MTPNRALEVTIRELLATDPAMLAQAADAPMITLVAAPFTEGPNVEYADLTPATYTGSAPKDATVGNQQAFFDPVQGVDVVQLNEPVGGWTWECTASPAAPETIYGYVVTDQANVVTYGCEVLDDPVTITAAGDAVVLPNVRMSIPLNVIE